MLLRSADHTVIKGFGVDDGFHGHAQIRRLINDHVTVTGADADSGGTGRVSGLHHAGTTGGHDEIHVLHQVIGNFQRGD